MNEREYDIFREFFHVGFVASATAGLTGLVGLAAGAIMTHVSPENSQLAKEIIDFCEMPAIIGTFCSGYFGANYFINPPRK